jgi:hypothetical protein
MKKAKCRDCVWFPWKPDAVVSMLPPMKCHEKLEPRRWTEESAELEHDCPYFKSKESETEKKKEQKQQSKSNRGSKRNNDASENQTEKVNEDAANADTGTEEQAEEAAE